MNNHRVDPRGHRTIIREPYPWSIDHSDPKHRFKPSAWADKSHPRELRENVLFEKKNAIENSYLNHGSIIDVIYEQTKDSSLGNHVEGVLAKQRRQGSYLQARQNHDIAMVGFNKRRLPDGAPGWVENTTNEVNHYYNNNFARHHEQGRYHAIERWEAGFQHADEVPRERPITPEHD